MRYNPSAPRLAKSFQEASTCAWLGLRSAISLRALLTSLTTWFTVAVAWAIVFSIYREPITAMALKATAALVFGAASLIPGLPGSGLGVATGGTGAAVATTSSIVLSWLAAALLYAVLVVLTVRVLVELMLMGRIRAQVIKQYPLLSHGASAGASSDWRTSVRNNFGPWLGLAAGSIVCLLLPLIGGIALFVLLSYFNVRSLVNDAMEDFAGPREVRHFIQENRREMAVLGVLLTLLSFAPFIGFLAPWFTGSAVCHLTMRRASAAKA